MTVIQTADGRLLKQGVPPFQSNEYLVVSRGHGNVQLVGNLATTYELIYETNPNAAAVINKLVRQIATMPVKVYDHPDPDGQAQAVRKHPVADLLNHPAPRRGPMYWKQGLARSAFVHGNGLVAKFRGAANGPPKYLLPVGWPWVAAYAPLGAPVEWWSTYQTGTQRWFSVEDGLHAAWECADLHGIGVSPLKQLALTVKLDDAARRYQVSSFANGVRPSGAVVPPEGFKYQEGQREQLREEIKRLQEGVDNAGSMMLLAAGFDWKPFAQTAVEAEVIAARTIGREEFAMVYDVPPPMIGDLTHGTYSNVEELHRILYVTTLRPWFSLLEETLTTQLIEGEDQWAGNDLFVRFDLTEVLRGNRREEIDAMAEAFKNGLMTLNEAREGLDLPKIAEADDPDGLADMPHIPANNLKPLVPPDEPEAPAGEDPNQLLPGAGPMLPPAPTPALPEGDVRGQ